MPEENYPWEMMDPSTNPELNIPPGYEIWPNHFDTWDVACPNGHVVMHCETVKRAVEVCKREHKKQVKKSMNTQILDDVDNWQDAVTTLVDQYTDNDWPFTSGKIANEIRKLKPELNFAVRWVGKFIQELFYSNAIVFWAPEGHPPRPACMVPRVTTGTSRTGPGQEVFVYASHPKIAEQHDFEIDILKPNLNNGPLPTWVSPDSKKEWAEDEKIQERSGTYSVRIHADGRMCFTRPLLERFFHTAKCSVKGSTKVHIAAEKGKVTLTLEPSEDSSAYTLSTSRGRVLFPMKESSVKAGDLFNCIEITDSEITVTLR